MAGVINMKLVAIILFILTFIYGCAAELVHQPIAVQKVDLVDDDYDGVINARDKCPESPALALVDNEGCPDEVIVEQKQEMLVFFEHDSFVINTKNIPYIKKLARVLINKPERKLLIAGHASSVGKDKYNEKLAYKRAVAIQSSLLKFGVKQEQLKVSSYGAFKNMVKGSSTLAHSANRRVYFAMTSVENSLVTKWNIFSPEMLDSMD